jgi:ribosomal protein S14
MKNEINLTEKVETIPYDEKRVISRIACQTCGTAMSLYRGRFPICDDFLKVLREIIKERKENK